MCIFFVIHCLNWNISAMQNLELIFEVWIEKKVPMSWFWHWLLAQLLTPLTCVTVVHYCCCNSPPAAIYTAIYPAIETRLCMILFLSISPPPPVVIRFPYLPRTPGCSPGLQHLAGPARLVGGQPAGSFLILWRWLNRWWMVSDSYGWSSSVR